MSLAERRGPFAVLPVDKHRDPVVGHRVAQGDVLVPAIGRNPPLNRLREIKQDIVPTNLRKLGLSVDEVHVHRATEDSVTDLHPCDLPGLWGPDPSRYRGLVIGDIKVNRTHCLGSPDTQLHPRVVVRVGGLDKLKHGVGRVIRIGRQRDLILGALESDRVIA